GGGWGGWRVGGGRAARGGGGGCARRAPWGGTPAPADIRIGRYSGRPPAIASAMAQLSMVVTPPRGGKAPSSRRRGCAEPRRIQSTRSCVGGQTGRPPLQRLASIMSFARANASSTLDACTRIIGGSLAASPAKAGRHFVSPS